MKLGWNNLEEILFYFLLNLKKRFFCQLDYFLTLRNYKRSIEKKISTTSSEETIRPLPNKTKMIKLTVVFYFFSILPRTTKNKNCTLIFELVFFTRIFLVNEYFIPLFLLNEWMKNNFVLPVESVKISPIHIFLFIIWEKNHSNFLCYKLEFCSVNI